MLARLSSFVISEKSSFHFFSAKSFSIQPLASKYFSKRSIGLLKEVSNFVIFFISFSFL